MGDYHLEYVRGKFVQEAHRDAVIAVVRVSRDGEVLGDMQPRLNFLPQPA